MTETRLFFVVDSYEKNEEIFETREQAEKYLNELRKDNIQPDDRDHAMSEGARLYIALVKNAYREPDGPAKDQWNYEDFSDTFQIIKTLAV